MQRKELKVKPLAPDNFACALMQSTRESNGLKVVIDPAATPCPKAIRAGAAPAGIRMVREKWADIRRHAAKSESSCSLTTTRATTT